MKSYTGVSLGVGIALGLGLSGILSGSVSAQKPAPAKDVVATKVGTNSYSTATADSCKVKEDAGKIHIHTDTAGPDSAVSLWICAQTVKGSDIVGAMWRQIDAKAPTFKP